MRIARTLRSGRLIVALALLAIGCAQARKPEPRDWSGFLDDYSRLHLGDLGELPLVYRNPKTQWTAYDKVILEPVALWRSGRNALAAIPEADLLHLVARFERALRTRLGSGFQVVTAPGPGTLRLRLAVTEARAADPVVDVLTATPEDVGTVSGAIGPELGAFIEAAVIEGEIRDAVTDEILAQGIDTRRAGAPPRFTTWEALDRGLAFWADRVCSRLEARTRGR